ncbi:MAG TPA: YciI family protein [Solirubrobacterales bacterium]
MKYVLLYESAENVADKAPLHAAAHSEHWKPFRERGELLMIGPFGDPQSQGAMAVFTTRESAEQFAHNDPFVVNGVVRSWEVREWDEAVGS